MLFMPFFSSKISSCVSLHAVSRYIFLYFHSINFHVVEDYKTELNSLFKDSLLSFCV